jgi:hypothetical protein
LKEFPSLKREANEGEVVSTLADLGNSSMQLRAGYTINYDQQDDQAASLLSLLRRSKPKTIPKFKRWSREEDAKLRNGVAAVGPRQWKRIAEEFLDGERRDVQCLHRWQKVLQPGLVKGAWTEEEDQIVIGCIKSGITKWSDISAKIPGRIGEWMHLACT